MRSTLSLPAERWALAVVAAGLLAPIAATALAAFGVAPLAAFLIAGAIALLSLRPVAARIPGDWDGALQRHPAWCAVWGLVALAALARSAGVALYMADPTLDMASAFWFDAFYSNHSCFSALWKAATLSRDGAPNLYDTAHYMGHEGRFKLDEFMYFPQFLLLPRLGLALGGTFESLRALWFSIEAALVLGTLLAVCGWVGGRAGRTAALLIPAVWLGSPTLLTLQLGNFQLAAVAMSVLAMLLFQRGRAAAGGALLGFAVFKLFPGLLGVYLLCARRWRDAAWTFAFTLLYTVLALAWMGRAPFDAFLNYEMPRILSGEAWAFLEFEGLGAVVAINSSIPALVLKLRMIGVPGMSWDLQGSVAWGWTLVVIALAALAAARTPRMGRAEQAGAWLALLTLAAFRSPFVPDHNGLFAPLCLWAIVAAAAIARAGSFNNRLAALTVGGWCVLATAIPFSGMPLPDELGRLAISTTSQIVATGLCLWVLLRRPAGTTHLTSDAGVAQLRVPSSPSLVYSLSKDRS